MAAANTDKFKKLTNNFSTTLSSAILGAGDTSFSPASVTNLPTDTGTVFVIDRVNSSGVATPSTREYVVGVVSGGNVINLVRGQGGSTAQAHSTGAVVEQVVDQNTINDVMTGILVGHNQDGTHQSNLPLTTPQITTGIKDANGNTMIAFSPTTSAVNQPQLVNAATGNDPSIRAAGTDSTANLNLRGKGLAKTVTIGAGATPIFPYDYVVSGCVWSGDSYGSTRNASMTSGVVVINGNPITVATVTARAFTASKDTYIDVLDNGDGTGLLVYTEVTNNAASPALAANSVRIGIIVTGASSIANSGSVNQGQETMLLPIASSIPYTVTDSLGNLICPRDAKRQVLGYRQTTTAQTGISAVTDSTYLQVPVIVPTGRKIKLTPNIYFANGSSALSEMLIREGSSTLISYLDFPANTSNAFSFKTSPLTITPSAGSHTYKIAANPAGGSTTLQIYASATNISSLLVELV